MREKLEMGKGTRQGMFPDIYIVVTHTIISIIHVHVHVHVHVQYTYMYHHMYHHTYLQVVQSVRERHSYRCDARWVVAQICTQWRVTVDNK